MPPYLLAMLIGAALGGATLGGAAAWKTTSLHYQHQIDEAALAAQAAALKQTADILAKERAWAREIKGSTDAKEAELRRVGTERDAAVASLRNRAPNRLPAATAAACAGGTGLQLSRPDAIAFTGLAADAEGVVAELSACKAWIEAVRR